MTPRSPKPPPPKPGDPIDKTGTMDSSAPVIAGVFCVMAYISFIVFLAWKIFQ